MIETEKGERSKREREGDIWLCRVRSTEGKLESWRGSGIVLKSMSIECERDRMEVKEKDAVK